MSDETLAADVVRELVAEGAAEPLLAETEIGPTWYADRWWYVPVDGTDYQAAGPEMSAEFDRLKLRVQAINDVQAELDGRR